MILPSNAINFKTAQHCVCSADPNFYSLLIAHRAKRPPPPPNFGDPKIGELRKGNRSVEYLSVVALPPVVAGGIRFLAGLELVLA